MYTRRELAKRWGIRPWDVDRVPWHEVMVELQLSSIEDESERYWQEKRKRSKGI